MSLCDTCRIPGHCCRSIRLGGGQPFEAETVEQAEEWLEEVNLGWQDAPLPFKPLFKRGTDGGWVWWCPNLNPTTGRCDDYENRPHTCTLYEAGSDRICVHYEPGAEAKVLVT